jgi:hypothetical protein
MRRAATCALALPRSTFSRRQPRLEVSRLGDACRPIDADIVDEAIDPAESLLGPSHDLLPIGGGQHTMAEKYCAHADRLCDR